MKTLLRMLFVLVAVSHVPAFGQNTITNNSSSLDALKRELQELHDRITWGACATNGIQIGLSIFLGDGSAAKKFGTDVYLYSTNDWVGIYPPNGYRLSLSLKDTNGNNVEKTEQGNAISKPVGLITKYEIRKRRFDYLAWKFPNYYEGFYLLDCFDVKIAGTNTLMVGGTVYKWTDAGFREIALPPVSIQVAITQSDIAYYQASKRKVK